MIKWDDLTIRVTLPDGTKRQSHARVTNFSSRKNWLIEAEEGCPTLTTKNQIAGDAKKLKLPCLFFHQNNKYTLLRCAVSNYCLLKEFL